MTQVEDTSACPGTKLVPIQWYCRLPRPHEQVPFAAKLLYSFRAVQFHVLAGTSVNIAYHS
jgi:hypothetical protein